MFECPDWSPHSNVRLGSLADIRPLRTVSAFATSGHLLPAESFYPACLSELRRLSRGWLSIGRTVPPSSDFLDRFSDFLWNGVVKHVPNVRD
jgi:hypothetical protein